MKSKKITKIIVATVIAVTVVGSIFSSFATTTNFNIISSKKSGSSIFNETVLKVDIDETGLVTCSTDNSNETEEETKFSWDNATVYFALTDRFNNGDTSNDHSYGRGLDKQGNVQAGYENSPGAFHGGDLKGLTQKINEGYFKDLGVNAIWLTAPYEQIHGYTSGNAQGGNASNNGKGFPYYSYHGYWALDYTNIDKNMGNEQDFRDFVDAAHAQGIRVVMDIVLNHVGYTTMKDASEYGFGGLTSGWENYYYGDLSALSGGGVEAKTWYNLEDSKWVTNWWGSDFLRVSAGYAGYPKVNEGSGYADSLCGLPDIKTESTKEVSLPPLLANKWKSEGRYEEEMAELNEFFTEQNLPKTPRNYVIKWLTDYIRDFGIDGFRCDTANQVDLESWAALNEQADIAFEKYKEENPEKVLDENTDFWTTAESWGHGVTKSGLFTTSNFSSVINFGFKGASTANIKAKYNDLQRVNKDDSFNVLSYISSHDDTLHDRNNLIDGGTSLLLAPGAVQIFYGDETARPLGWTDFFTYGQYTDQMYRTSMNWDDLNNPNSQASKTLAHWQKVGQFRNNHLAVGAGENIDIADAPYTFGRVYNKDGYSDRVVCVVGASGTIDVDVSKVFSNGSKVRDAYTGVITTVKNGKATFTAGANGVILIEKGDKSPDVGIYPGSKNYFTDSIDLKLTVSNVEKGTYKINNGSEKTFTNGEVITIGEGLNFETVTTISLYAENEDGNATATYTYTKKDPDKIKVKVHYYNENNWDNPYVYMYREENGVVENIGAWPGVKMESEGNGWYSYLKQGWMDARVIFSNAGASQNPGKQQPGFLVEDEMWYKNGTWYNYNPDGPIKKELIINKVSIDKTEAKVGDSIKIVADATGNDNLLYKVSVHEIVDGWKNLSEEYSSSNISSWTPKKAGTYKIWVDVKDSENLKKSKYITIEVVE